MPPKKRKQSCSICYEEGHNERSCKQRKFNGPPTKEMTTSDAYNKVKDFKLNCQTTPEANFNAKLFARYFSLQLFTIPGDGHCMYHCLVNALREAYGESATVQQLRNKAYSVLQNNRDFYSAFNSDNYDNYLHGVKTNSYGDHITLQILCIEYNLQVFVFDAVQCNVLHLSNNGEGRHIWVTFDPLIEHYNLCLPLQLSNTNGVENIRKRIYNKSNQIEINKRQSLYNKENRDSINSSQRNYNEQHREQIIENQRNYNEQHTEQIVENQRNYD